MPIQRVYLFIFAKKARIPKINPPTIGINETQPSDAHIMMQRIINAILGMLFVFVA